MLLAGHGYLNWLDLAAYVLLAVHDCPWRNLSGPSLLAMALQALLTGNDMANSGCLGMPIYFAVWPRLNVAFLS